MSWQLVDANGAVVKNGAKLTTFRGEACTLEGGAPPHHSGSSGRVYVKLDGFDREFFPSVVKLTWKEK